jgi:hypothetical protein
MSYNENRPWLNVLSLKFQPSPIHPPQIVSTCEIEIKNYGKLPATRVNIQLFLSDIFDNNFKKILLGEQQTIVHSCYVDIIMPDDLKKSTLLYIGNINQIVSAGSGIFNVGIIVNYFNPSGKLRHSLSQMWTAGSHIYLNQLQPFNPNVFLNPGHVVPVAVLKKTFKLT